MSRIPQPEGLRGSLKWIHRAVAVIDMCHPECEFEV